jgi:hypothetical protein
MNTKGVTWATYAPPINTSGFEWNLLQFFANEYFGTDYTNNLRLQSNMVSDFQNCNLPQFTVVTPSFANSEHAPASVQTGEQWVGSAINALMQNQACWYSTVIFITWDDHGGYYDHYQPPTGDASHLGPRVPFLCVGWPCKNTIDTTHNYEFASVISYLETLFSLCGSPPGCLSGRDATAPSISNMINTGQTPLGPAVQSQHTGTFGGGTYQ